VADILVLAEAHNPAPEPIALAATLGHPIVLVPLAEEPGPDLVATFGALGATQVVAATGPAGAHPRVYPAAVAAALASLVQTYAAPVVVLPGGRFGAEIAGLLSLQVLGGVVTNVSDVKADLTAIKPVMAGTAVATARVLQGVTIVTVKPGAASGLVAPPVAEPRVVEVSLPEPDPRVEVVAVTPRARAEGRPPLLTAAAIVAAGRGTGGDLSQVEELADALGAAMGASRAAVDAGWVDHALQVGQTGKTVTPALYVAAGISGAIQHQAGMRGAQAIVAVNTDPNAPIFAMADLGIVGDLKDFLPRAAAAVRAARGT
jgi:electron transfer flavoprotein alpha subunit